MAEPRQRSLHMRLLPLAVALALSAACSKAPTTEELLAQAKQYQAEGKNPAAIIQLRNLLDKNPKHAEARYTLGMIYRQMNAPHSAEKEFRMALAAGYDKKVIQPLLAEALFKQGQFEKLLEETRSSDHGDIVLTAPILAMRGHAQATLGHRDAAAEMFQAALARQPDYTDALLGQARLAQINNQPQQAETLIRRAVSSNPKNLDALLLLADLEQSKGNQKEALADYLKAYAIAPYSVPVNLNLASIYLHQNLPQQARKHVDALLKVAPDNPMAYYLLALLEYGKQDFSATEAALEKVRKAAPNHLPASVLAGLVAQSSGNDAAAEKQLRAPLAKAPNNPYLRKLLASSLLRNHKAQQAIDLLEGTQTAVPADSQLLALLGEAYRQKQDLAKARYYFGQALQKAPQDSRIKTGLGLTQLVSGDTNQALAQLESLTSGDGGQNDELLATSLLAAGQYDRAMQVVKRLENTQPRKALTFNLKGSILLAKGNAAAARDEFVHATRLQPDYLPAAMNLAQLDARAGKLDLARGHLLQVIKHNPKNVDAPLALAELEMSSGHPVEARRWLEKAAQAQPGSFKPRYAQARLTFGNGDFKQAIPQLQAALKLAPEHAEALNMLAYAYLQTGQHPEALSVYSRLVSMFPRSAQAQFNLSLAQSNSGNLASAEISLKKALLLDPGLAPAQLALAALQLKQGQSGEALQLGLQAQKRNPKAAEGYLIEGDAQSARQQYAAASAAFEKAYQLRNDSVALIKWQNALRAQGKIADADLKLSAWLKSHPNDIAAHLNAADAAMKTRRFDVAAEHYRQVLQQQPAHIGARHNLLLCYRQSKDTRALELAEQSYKAYPENQVTRLDLANLLQEQGQHTRAIELLQLAVEATPDATIRYQLVQAYLKADNKAQARIELEQVVNSSNKDFAQRNEAEMLLKKLQN